jgi:hypothetical protein
MLIGEKAALGALGACFAAMVVVVVALAVSDYRAGVRSRAFMSQCIEKWAPAQCKVWDEYGRHDLAFRKSVPTPKRHQKIAPGN